MSAPATDLEDRLARFVEHHVMHGARLPIESLCDGRPDLVAPLRALVDQYLSLTTSLTGGTEGPRAAAAETALPSFDGFQTIERLGSGGMGEVYKLRDLTLDRIVAGKIVRRDRPISGVTGFLREARAMALFSDRRVVRIFEYREGDPALIVMEYVEGFELGKIGPSLEFAQRARVLADVCDTLHHAHGLGIQHRDLKPSNIMVDAALAPRVLDFGLSDGDPRTGHLKGTVRYIAPEQLDPSQPIGARTDVYALGVVLYELLCGRAPYDGASDHEIADAIRAARPRLPIEIDPRVPEPLQAIALKAMERDPAHRYQTAQDMALDLRRYVAGRPVLARPSVYASTLGSRTAAHLEHITDWLQLRLIHPHEAERLRHAYGTLDAREDDWILESRSLSYTQISLYLGAFLLVCGSLFYFVASRWYHTVQGIGPPLVVLGLPFLGLNLAARRLYRRDHKVVAVAFYLAAVATLPLLLMILFDETGVLVAAPGAVNELFPGRSLSNHQLQVTTLVACVWCGILALSTRTLALATVFAMLAFIFGLSAAADFGLRGWIVQSRWDLVALHLSPLVAIYAALGLAADRLDRAWLGRPLYRAAGLLLIVLMELLAQNGRMSHYLGISLPAWQGARVSDPQLLDTVAAMTLNGLCFYAIAAVLRRRGTALMAGAAGLLFAASPFAVLQPLAYLVRTGDYSLRFDWVYLWLALAVTLLSERRQRKSFYYAGLLNTGAALYLIADHRHWFDRPWWGAALILAGLAALAAGFVLDRQSRSGRT